MDILETLESNVAQWADAIAERTRRADYLHGECDRLVGETLDLSEAKAKQARKDRAEYLAELELIGAQMSELARRLEVAKQAVREYHLDKAEQAYAQADHEAREKRQALDAAFDARLHFMNRGGRQGQTDETVREQQAHEIAIANARAEVTIANRKAQETGAALRALRES